jgi:hypothetical protein
VLGAGALVVLLLPFKTPVVEDVAAIADDAARAVPAGLVTGASRGVGSPPHSRAGGGREPVVVGRNA